METFWLMQGFDSLNANHFLPSPTLFRTEEEAVEFCRRHSRETLHFGYRSVRVGKIEIKGKT